MTNDTEPEINMGPAKPTARPTVLIKEYLRQHLEVYRELAELQKQGWESKEGDTYFQTLQQKADAAGTKAKTGFFKLMVHIGAQLNAATSAFDIKPLTSPLTPAILDLCMAPAGARPQPDRLLLALGGHEMLLPNWQTDPRIKIDFRDITILALEMGLPPLSPPLLNQPPLPAAAHPTST